jgi:dTDP-4-dehydrorhamnose 3,5-epimerase
LGKVSLGDICVTPLKKIHVTGGDVWHIMKKNDDGYVGFGEAYFSQVEYRVVKAWKRHLQMTMNLIVPVGEVRFVFADDSGSMREERVGVDNYVRLTIPPGIWFGFQGVSENTALLLNIADIKHSPNEVERKKVNEFKYEWELIK